MVDIRDDLEQKLETVKGELAVLEQEIKAIGAKSQQTIKMNSEAVSASLQSSVDAVAVTLQLEGAHNNSQAIEINKEAKRSLEQMHQRFSILRDTAKVALRGVEDLKVEWAELCVSLDNMRVRLEDLRTRAQQSLDGVASLLASKRSELRSSSAELDEKEQEMAVLEAQIAADLKERDELRAWRTGFWIASVVIWPLVIGAATLEGIAATQGKQRKEKEEELVLVKTKMSSIQTEITGLKSQEETLAGSMTTAEALCSKCALALSGSNQIEKGVEDKFVEYHTLVQKTDDFGAWTDDLTSHTEVLRVFKRPTKELIVRRTKTIVECFLTTDHQAVKAIEHKLDDLLTADGVHDSTRRIEDGTKRGE